MGIFSKILSSGKALFGADGVDAVRAPVSGKLIRLSDVPDEVFASGAFGEGFGIWPHSGEIISPLSGVISALTPTRHAIGITGEDGLEVMVHVGVDTVKMQGEGFVYHVGEGQSVEMGERLLSFDSELIASRGYRDIVITVLPSIPSGAEIGMLLDGGFVDAGEPVLEVVSRS